MLCIPTSPRYTASLTRSTRTRQISIRSLHINTYVYFLFSPHLFIIEWLLSSFLFL